MLEVQEQVPLAPRTTIHAGGTAHYFIHIPNETQLPEVCAFAREKKVPLHPLGDGSNTLFADGSLELCVVKLANPFIRVWSVEQNLVYVESGAGTEWDAFVLWTIQRGYAGVECLSGIPGTVGAAPIQNIGAYGQELKQTLVQVRAYDTKLETYVSLPVKQCGLDYRTSIFKDPAYKNRYILTSIVCRLSLRAPTPPTYTDIQNYFQTQNIQQPSLANIRDAVLTIRTQKLPDYHSIPNAGSFFKNPIIPKERADALQKQYPNIKLFPIDNAQTKLAAGWLIDQCGLKGSYIGPVGIYEKNALVLTNANMASCADIIQARDSILKQVQEKFGITLEMEPEIVG